MILIVLFAGSQHMDSIVLDQVENKLYFTSYSTKKVEAVNVNGDGATLLIETTYSPSGLAVDQERR